MNRRLLRAGLILAVPALLITLFASRTTTIYALASRGIEIVFNVTDAATGEGIANADVQLRIEDYREKGREERVLSLATDEAGRAAFVREDNSCEDVIGPFGRRRTLIDLTWASVTVSAEGYLPLQDLDLHPAKYEETYIEGGNFHRLVFKLALAKRPGG